VTQALKTLLNDSAEFRAILGKAQHLEDLKQLFVASAPAHLAQTCHILSLEFGVLTLATGNGSIAAKLNQLAPEIASNMKNRGAEVSGIRVKVQVSYTVSSKPKNTRQLRSAAQTAIDELSNTLADSPLKNALKKMTDKHSV
jgi:hypothetical protein